MSKSQDVKTPAPQSQAKSQTPWKPQQKGIPVEKGQNFASLSEAQRKAHFNQHEHHWKKLYNAQKGTVNAQHNFTRG